MRLIHSEELEPRHAPHVHSHEDAVAQVASQLDAGWAIAGLDELQWQHGRVSNTQLLERLESGEWLLLDDHSESFNWANYEAHFAPAREQLQMRGNRLPGQRVPWTEGPATVPKKLQDFGRVFAKSSSLGQDQIDYDHHLCAPVEPLSAYGHWAVLGTGQPATVGNLPLKLIGGTLNGTQLARTVGVLALGVAEGAVAGLVVGTVALLIPNNTGADMAFYRREQYTELDRLRTRVRVSLKELPDGAIDAYGFYTGKHPQWENVPKIAATQVGEHFVFDLGDNLTLTWTPAVDTTDILGTPALEGVPALPNILVYPPEEEVTQQALENPIYPPDYKDAILWFPAHPGMAPIYIALSVGLPGDHKYKTVPDFLPAFPEAIRVRGKTMKSGGGLRARWKEYDGSLLEWDSQHGTIEKYNKRGRHLGEYDFVSGSQTKPADKKRAVEP